jgi:uncharacterized protein YdeI (YjbR/CyaY-like superfamily)
MESVLNTNPVLFFEKKEDWNNWLENNHSESKGIWIKIMKKASGIESLNYKEALEVALCYGWIDGQKNPFNDVAWLQKFTPRNPKSIWSKINKEKAELLIKEEKMRAAGLTAIENAKLNGNWDIAYDSYKTASIPDDLQLEFDRNESARSFFETLNRTNRYAILFRIQNTKNAITRKNRIDKFIQMLEKKEKLYP